MCKRDREISKLMWKYESNFVILGKIKPMWMYESNFVIMLTQKFKYAV